MNNICAIILAAGSGSRMKSDVKKQFIDCNGKPLFAFSLKTISEIENVTEIILVTSKDDIDYVRKVTDELNITKVSKIISGGERRQDSVYEALKIVDDSYEYVLIHDSARPFVKVEDIKNVINDGIKYECATLGVNVKDTIKIADVNGLSHSTPDRNTLYSVQTPQVLNRKKLTDGHKKHRDINFTDDTAVMEKMGVKTKITLGSYSNIKVTTKEDLIYLKDLI